MRLLLVLTTAFSLVVLLAGCPSSSIKPDEDYGPEYLARTSPENVLTNLVTAYTEMDLEGYACLFAEDFVFYTAEADQDPSNEDPLPESWDWEYEEECHDALFASEVVREITLTLTTIQADSLAAPDGSGETWYQYYEAVDLLLIEVGQNGWLVTLPSLFRFRRIENPTGPDLFEIVEWYDNPYDVTPGPANGRVESTTWSGIKGMFLES